MIKYITSLGKKMAFTGAWNGEWFTTDCGKLLTEDAGYVMLIGSMNDWDSMRGQWVHRGIPEFFTRPITLGQLWEG